MRGTRRSGILPLSPASAARSRSYMMQSVLFRIPGGSRSLNLRFLDLQPAQRLPDLLATADIHLLPQKAEAADLVMPRKLTGMLASARAVVARAHVGTELASVVQGCGLVVPPGDAVAFAHAVRALASDRAQREQLGAAGYLYAQEHLDRQAVLQKFEADVLAMISNGR